MRCPGPLAQRQRSYLCALPTPQMQEYLHLRQEWRPRILSNGMAHLFNRWTAGFSQDHFSHLQWTDSLYSLLWLPPPGRGIVAGIGKARPAFPLGADDGPWLRLPPWACLPRLSLGSAGAHSSSPSSSDSTTEELTPWLPVVILTGALFKETTIALIPALILPSNAAGEAPALGTC